MEKTNKKKGLRIALVVLAVLLVLGLAGYTVFAHYASKLNYVPAEATPPDLPAVTPQVIQAETPEEQEALEEAVARLLENLESQSDWDYSSKDVTNILLIGVDNDTLAGLNDLGNADGLVIASINKSTRQLVLTSLMRDIYVAIPDAFNTKITLSYHYGGTKMLIDTVEANFGIPIDNYILVNYINVVDIVDAFGGLELDVNASELYYMQGKIESVNRLVGAAPSDNQLSPDMAGRLTLNGVQVAAYLRVRMAGNNDFERTERARRVIGDLLDKARDMSFSELNAMADTVLPCITTDLSQGRIFSLLLDAPQFMQYQLISNRIPIDDSFSFANIGGSMVVIDYPVNREFLYQSIYMGKS